MSERRNIYKERYGGGPHGLGKKYFIYFAVI